MQQALSLSSDFSLMYNADFQTGDFYPGAWPVLQPLVKEYYYQYPVYFYSTIDNGAKVEKAFKIAQMLIDKKFVKSETIKNFIELINDIVGVI